MTGTNDIEPVNYRERVNQLAEAVGFDSLRLMIDPETTPSEESVLKGLCLFLEEELNGNANSTLAFSIESNF